MEFEFMGFTVSYIWNKAVLHIFVGYYLGAPSGCGVGGCPYIFPSGEEYLGRQMGFLGYAIGMLVVTIITFGHVLESKRLEAFFETKNGESIRTLIEESMSMSMAWGVYYWAEWMFVPTT